MLPLQLPQAPTDRVVGLEEFCGGIPFNLDCQLFHFRLHVTHNGKTHNGVASVVKFEAFWVF